MLRFLPTTPTKAELPIEKNKMKKETGSYKTFGELATEYVSTLEDNGLDELEGSFIAGVEAAEQRMAERMIYLSSARKPLLFSK